MITLVEVTETFQVVVVIEVDVEVDTITTTKVEENAEVVVVVVVVVGATTTEAVAERKFPVLMILHSQRTSETFHTTACRETLT